MSLPIEKTVPPIAKSMPLIKKLRSPSFVTSLDKTELYWKITHLQLVEGRDKSHEWSQEADTPAHQSTYVYERLQIYVDCE